MAENPSENFIEILGVRTFYTKTGKGKPLVMLHGGSPGTCSTLNWKPNIQPIAEAGFTVYTFDQPGFGRSEVPKDHSMDFRVKHSLSFIETFNLKEFHLIGNSMGAYIAASIALQHKNNPGRLILISSNTLAPKGSPVSQKLAKAHSADLRGYIPSLESMKKLSLGTFFNPKLVTEDFVQERYEMSKGALYEAMLNRQKAPKAKSLVNDLHKLTMKTLIFWGANDKGAALECAMLLLNSLPNAELHIFNKCAHWVHWDQADRFNQVVGDYLSQSS